MSVNALPKFKFSSPRLLPGGRQAAGPIGVEHRWNSYSLFPSPTLCGFPSNSPLNVKHENCFNNSLVKVEHGWKFDNSSQKTKKQCNLKTRWVLNWRLQNVSSRTNDGWRPGGLPLGWDAFIWCDKPALCLLEDLFCETRVDTWEDWNSRTISVIYRWTYLLLFIFCHLAVNSFVPVRTL